MQKRFWARQGCSVVRLSDFCNYIFSSFFFFASTFWENNDRNNLWTHLQDSNSKELNKKSILFKELLMWFMLYSLYRQKLNAFVTIIKWQKLGLCNRAAFKIHILAGNWVQMMLSTKTDCSYRNVWHCLQYQCQGVRALFQLTYSNRYLQPQGGFLTFCVNMNAENVETFFTHLIRQVSVKQSTQRENAQYFFFVKVNDFFNDHWFTQPNRFLVWD